VGALIPLVDLYVALFSIPFSIVMFLGIRWLWFRYKLVPYSKNVVISDAWLISASFSIFPFFVEIVPLLEQLCLTAGQQSALEPFRILIALWVTLGAVGIFIAGENGRKVSASVLVFALLVGGTFRVVVGNDPCQSEATAIVVKAPDIGLLTIASWVLVAISFTASLLYIWEFVSRKHRERRDRFRSDD